MVLIASCSSEDEEVLHPKEDMFGSYYNIQYDTLPNSIYPEYEGVYVVPMIAERADLKLEDAIKLYEEGK